MDYRRLQPQPGMARLNGSNRAAWNAMDLEIGAQVPPSNARGGVEDCGALSARNVLLRQKLRERKRYDSADDAMKKAAARANAQYQHPDTPSPNQIHLPDPNPTQDQNQIHARERPFSPAQMGQAVFFNAMDNNPSPQYVQRNTTTLLYESPGGAVEGRNVLMQRKLQPNKGPSDAVTHYPVVQDRDGHETVVHVADRQLMDVKNGAAVRKEAVSSPCASFVVSSSRRQQFTSMSPSRAGKYGALENKTKPNRRDLLKQQEQQQQQGSPVCPSMQHADQTGLQSGGSDYGKLSAAHVLIRRKLKERKRFDSADYAMEKQGRPSDLPADVVVSPATPGTASSRYSTPLMSQTAMNHQVKHIKLSEAPSERATAGGVGNAGQAALAARAARYAGLKKGNTFASNDLSQPALDYGLNKNATHLGAAAARNLVLQRKLAERKMFDSADHFKEAA